jgi:hypothetical protein
VKVVVSELFSQSFHHFEMNEMAMFLIDKKTNFIDLKTITFFK